MSLPLTRNRTPKDLRLSTKCQQKQKQSANNDIKLHQLLAVQSSKTLSNNLLHRVLCWRCPEISTKTIATTQLESNHTNSSGYSTLSEDATEPLLQSRDDLQNRNLIIDNSFKASCSPVGSPSRSSSLSNGTNSTLSFWLSKALDLFTWVESVDEHQEMLGAAEFQLQNLDHPDLFSDPSKSAFQPQITRPFSASVMDDGYRHVIGQLTHSNATLMHENNRLTQRIQDLEFALHDHVEHLNSVYFTLWQNGYCALQFPDGEQVHLSQFHGVLLDFVRVNDHRDRRPKLGERITDGEVFQQQQNVHVNGMCEFSQNTATTLSSESSISSISGADSVGGADLKTAVLKRFVRPIRADSNEMNEFVNWLNDDQSGTCSGTTNAKSRSLEDRWETGRLRGALRRSANVSSSTQEPLQLAGGFPQIAPAEDREHGQGQALASARLSQPLPNRRPISPIHGKNSSLSEGELIRSYERRSDVTSSHAAIITMGHSESSAGRISPSLRFGSSSSAVKSKPVKIRTQSIAAPKHNNSVQFLHQPSNRRSGNGVGVPGGPSGSNEEKSRSPRRSLVGLAAMRPTHKTNSSAKNARNLI